MRIFKSRKFRVDILTIFITIFLIAILGITYYFYSRSNDAVLKVANGFISRTLDSISQKMNGFLQPIPLLGISKLILNDKQIDQIEMNSLDSYMQIILNLYPQLVNIYIVDASGNFFIENRITHTPLSREFVALTGNRTIPKGTKYVSAIVTDNAGKNLVKFIYKNELGNKIQQTVFVPTSFNPSQRPWYVETKESNQSKWIGVYPSINNAGLVVTIAFPVFSGDKLVGITAADLSVDAIEKAMARFSIDAKGVVFIANRRGQLIAYQDKTNQLTPNTLQTVYTVKDPLIRKAYQIYLNDQKDKFTFDYNGTTYISHFKTYSISGQQHWEIAAVVPIDVFIGSLNEANKKVLAFSFLTLFIGLILVIISSNRISKPIIQLAAETADMKNLNFENKSHIHSYIYEIQVMLNAINVAKAALYSFSKYVPRILVEQLLKMGTIAELGGSKKKITILFSDISDFTSITETTDPNLLMLHLSDYLNVLTKCVHENKGNIDKYIGDSLMAFWGTPQDDENQVHHACLALLICQREIHLFNQKAVTEGKPIFATRFGLNTGLAIVGNLGSSDRLNYTAIGDTVNTASRLEQINKVYGTELIVSEDVYAACAIDFIFRPIDVITLKGKHDPVQFYELIAENKQGLHFPATEQQLRLAKEFTEAYHLFHAKNIKHALEFFMTLSKEFPEDKLIQIYIKRCHEQGY